VTIETTVLECINHLFRNHPHLARQTVEIVKDIWPQDDGVRLSIRGLISRYCSGNGLEIGPGKRPYCDQKTTVYLDKFQNNKDGTENPDIFADAIKIPLPSSHLDYVFSSHVLEHMQDTIGALKEWGRVLKEGGILFLVLPHADRTFDKNRAKTTLEHHISDSLNLGDDYDRSHNDEIKRGWSKNEDAEEAARAYFTEWGVDTWDFEFRLKNGVIHFHVWTQDEIVRLLQYLGYKIIFVLDYLEERSDSFIVISKK
jgi:SAM-dependent methyltransferase